MFYPIDDSTIADYHRFQMKFRYEIEPRQGYLSMRCEGPWEPGTSREAWQQLADGLALLEHGLALVDDRAIELETSTSLDFRHASFVADLLSPISRRVAVLDCEENSGANRFFETVCVNRGLRLRFFVEQQAALDWLLD